MAIDEFHSGASLHGMLRAIEQREGGRALHEISGLLHAGYGDDAHLRRWLARAAALLGMDAAFLVEGSADGAALVRQLWSEGIHPAASWRLPDLAQAPVGHAILETSNQLSTSVFPRDAGTLLAGTLGSHAWGCAGIVKVSPQRLVALVALRRSEPEAPAEVCDNLTRLLWHVYLACNAATPAARAPAGLTPADMVRMLPLPALLTDRAGRCVDRNEAFERTMPLLGIRIMTGRMRFADPFLQGSWQSALDEVHVTAVNQSLLAGTQNGRTWQIHVAPMPDPSVTDEAARRHLILALFEERTPMENLAPHPVLATAAQRLTPAESEVLNSLLQGHSAKIIASSRGASVNTVRSQIMAILEKTGYHNQKSLMAAFSNSSFGSSTFGNSTFGDSAQPPLSRRDHRDGRSSAFSGD